MKVICSGPTTVSIISMSNSASPRAGIGARKRISKKMTINADLLIPHPLVPLLRERLFLRAGGEPPFEKFIFGLPDRVATNKASLTKSVVLKKLITGTIYIKL